MKASPSIVCALLVFAMGCGPAPTTPDREPTELDTSRRDGFMGLEDGPLQADWDEWTPRPQRAAQSMEPILTFDVWHLTDRAQKDRLWASIFSLVSFARGYLPPDADPTVREVLTLLDPSAHEAVETDFIFFVGADAETEGVLVRTHRTLPNGGTVGVVLELRRGAGAGDNPNVIVLHLHSGFVEAPNVAISLDQPESLTYRVGEMERSIAVEGEEVATELSVVRDIIVQSFWRPVIGNGYVEPPFDVVREVDGTPSVDFPAGHGVEPDLRPIDRVWTDTVFPPRIELPAPAN